MGVTEHQAVSRSERLIRSMDRLSATIERAFPQVGADDWSGYELADHASRTPPVEFDVRSPNSWADREPADPDQLTFAEISAVTDGGASAEALATLKAV